MPPPLATVHGHSCPARCGCHVGVGHCTVPECCPAAGRVLMVTLLGVPPDPPIDPNQGAHHAQDHSRP